MHITVSLHGVFRMGRFKEKTCYCPEHCAVQYMLDDLDIPADLLGIILINNRHARAQDILANGDVLKLLPLLDGG